jgi:hypothetical protein
MHGDAPDQPGATGRGYRVERPGGTRHSGVAPRSAGVVRPWSVGRNVTWVYCSMILLLVSRPAPARGQHEQETAREIPVHPRVTTIVEMPDEIELARFAGQTSGMMEGTKAGNLLYIRPRAGLPAGTEVALLVRTATVSRRFRLRVVGRARDAWSHVTVMKADAEPAPAWSTATADPGPTAKPDEASASPAPAKTRSRRIKISMHFVGSMGFVALDVAGFRPATARQVHTGLSVRLMVTRPDARWALEANLGGELPGGPISFFESDAQTPELYLTGPWLRAEVGTRFLLGGTKWNPSLTAGLGVHAHLRRTSDMRDGSGPSETMPRGVVLVLGLGLQRRIGDLLLGVDFQLREGGPDGYHFVGLFWGVGGYLDLD